MLDNSTFDNSTDVICLPGQKQQPQHVLYQLANICFIVAYLAPMGKPGLLFMHTVLIFGFFIFSMWAWNIICAPDIFSWNFFFMLLNMGQFLHVLYTMRKVKFPAELEDIYHSLFQPLQVCRLSFKKLVSPEFAQMLSLHPGEAYAMQNLTRADRLGLLVTGRANVLSGHHFLHHIQAKEFLDSPEFESSRTGVEEKFKVTIVATTCCRVLVWQRQSLEYLLIKETHLSNVLGLLLSRDITRKLYAMNDKFHKSSRHPSFLGYKVADNTMSICDDYFAQFLCGRGTIQRKKLMAILPVLPMVTEKGSHLDIRLPSLTGSIASHEEIKLKEAKARKESVFSSKFLPRPSIFDRTSAVSTE